MAKQSKSKDGRGSKYVVISLLVGVCVVAIWSSSALVLPSVYPEISNRGEFGDSFGAVNALFSGLAFAGLVIALLLQMRELQLQREQIERNRVEFERTASAQERAADANVLKQVYDYAISTNASRLKLFENAKVLRRVTDQESLRKFETKYAKLARDLNAAANCYHYIGFLIHSGILAHRMDDILQEGSHTIVRLHDLVHGVIELQRQAPGRSAKYKQYFDWLAARAKSYNEKNQRPIDPSSNPRSSA